MAKTIFAVSQVNAYINNIFKNDYALRDIIVRGEVSNCTYNGSGHIYFTLKDESSAISAVMFAGKRARGLNFKLENGQKIIVAGSIQVYEVSGRYQIYANQIILDGIGDLYKAYEETKKRLEEMGMFSEQYKKPIPKFASKVGIVTAKTGAAIQDIINISTRRNPFTQLYLCPATVQGDTAAATIVAGIEKLDKLGLDVIIVGRGGGSIEDLWPFNEEVVARAIFNARTPIISAVGHETDTTIADYVADLRAPTPSAAAELAVYDVRQFLTDLKSQNLMLNKLMLGRISSERMKLNNIQNSIKLQSPRYKLDSKRTFLLSAEETLRSNSKMKRSAMRSELSVLSARLSAVSPLDKISKGFGFITNKDGESIKTIEQVCAGDEIKVRISDGTIECKAVGIDKNKQ